MNRKKTRIILLSILIITNIILLGIYLTTEKKLNNRDTKEFARETVDILKEHNITVSTPIPIKKKPLKSLRVEFESIGPETLNDRFFEGEGQVETPSRNKVEIQNKNEFITVINDKRILYENTGVKKGEEKIEKDDAEFYCLRFLKEKGYDTKDMSPATVEEDHGKFYVNFYKKYKDKVLEKSFTNFTLDEKGIKTMDRLWLNVIEEGSLKIHIWPASKALLSLISNEDYEGKEIVDINMCWYFDPEAQGYVEDITKAKQGRAIPAWRIVFSDGESTIVEGY